MLVGSPAHPPSDEQLAPLRAALAVDAAVKEGYFFLVGTSEGQGLAIGGVLSEPRDAESSRAMFEALHVASGPFTTPDGWVDFLVLEPGGGLYEARHAFIPLLER